MVEFAFCFRRALIGVLHDGLDRNHYDYAADVAAQVDLVAYTRNMARLAGLPRHHGTRNAFWGAYDEDASGLMTITFWRLLDDPELPDSHRRTIESIRALERWARLAQRA